MPTRSKTSSKAALAATMLLCGVAGGLCYAPGSISHPVRTAVLDATAPGQRLASTVIARAPDWFDRIRPSSDDGAKLAAARAEADRWRGHAHALEATTAVLNERIASLERSSGTPYRAQPRAPLIVPELIEARVIGEQTASAWRSGPLLDKGLADSLAADALVLESGLPVIDQGLDAGLAADQPVYAGRTVLGKIGLAGRRISSVQAVTDARYRGGARVYHNSHRGMLPGPQGILEGRDGPLCRLRLIPSTALVGVGDEVFTAERDGTLPLAMYYGRVVQAELKPGALEWDVWVRPAATDVDSRHVAVLKRKLNSVRLLTE